MRSALVRAAQALVIVALAGWAPQAGAQHDPRAFNRPIAAESLDQGLFNQAVLHYSNAARRKHSLAPLKPDPGLTQAAATHAQNMARLKTHAHVLPVRGQRHLQDRMRRQSVSYRTAAENIAMDKVYRLLGRPISTSSRGCNFVYADNNQQVPVHTYGSLAEQVVNRWMASPNHRQSLLSKRFERLGAGVGIDPSGTGCGDVYLVQNFAG